MKPDPLFTAIALLVILLGLAAPGACAFVGAYYWRRTGGLIGLLSGYFVPLVGGFRIITLMDSCRPKHGCIPSPLPPLPELIADEFK
jgi:hypothetical protein